MADADVLQRMVSGRTEAHELARLLPWAWQAERLAMPECRDDQMTLAIRPRRYERLCGSETGLRGGGS